MVRDWSGGNGCDYALSQVRFADLVQYNDGFRTRLVGTRSRSPSGS
jgi:hypothetical protein